MGVWRSQVQVPPALPFANIRFSAESGERRSQVPRRSRPDGVYSISRGIGYAGENDVLTATLVGALCAAYGQTTFTEMFCPDWKGGSIFLSHMGEINVGLAAQKPLLVTSPYPWAKISPPVIAAFTLKAGPAVFANIVPGPHGAFGLILAPVEVLPEPAESRYTEKIRAWIKPRCSLETLLQEYSRHGGTHHAALVMSDRTPDLEKFAFLAGLECVRIGE